MLNIRSLIIFAASVMLLTNSISPIHGYEINISYTDLYGDIVEYQIYSGKPLLIETFATWAAPSQIQTQKIFIVENKTRSIINLLSLSVSPESDTVDLIKAYKSNNGANWEYGLDSASEFSDLFNIVFIPTIFLFDGDGDVLHKWEGITEADVILDKIESIPGFIAESNKTNSTINISNSSTISDTSSISADLKIGDNYLIFISLQSLILMIFFKKNK